MKHFTKTLVAAALLATSAGAANASINQATSSTGTAAEAFLQVYDHTQGLTYDLDLGVTVATLLANAASFTNLHYDLSGTNWTSFTNAATFTPGDTKFGVVGGNGAKFVFSTDSATAPLIVGNSALATAGGSISLAAGRINTGSPTNTAENLSKLVADTATQSTGQWAATANSTNVLTNLWGTFAGASAAIAYGLTGDIYYESLVGGVITAQKLGTVTLAGNNLDIAAVPLPAAVWMFGAGLMGILRMNRRKSMAV